VTKESIRKIKLERGPGQLSISTRQEEKRVSWLLVPCLVAIPLKSYLEGENFSICSLSSQLRNGKKQEA
jgi:hypothetical protein